MSEGPSSRVWARSESPSSSPPPSSRPAPAALSPEAAAALRGSSGGGGGGGGGAAPLHSPMRHFVAGAVGGSLAAVVLSPLDILRTRLQSQHAVRMRPDRLLLHIVRTEGAVGLYRGLVPTILGVGPSRALYFGFYSYAKQVGGEHSGWGWRGAPLHLAAAVVSGLATNTLMSPWWVIRLRLQLQTTPVRPLHLRLREQWAAWRGGGGGGGSVGAGAGGSLQRPALSHHPLPSAGYTGIVDCALRIYREEGARAFYRGLTASYLGVFETALQFALYGWMKEAIIEQRSASAEAALRRGGGEGSPGPSRADISRAAYSGGWAFLASATSKLLASAATYPHEVIRTRMREQRGDEAIKYRTILQSCRTVWAEEGARGLYGGMSVHLLRTVPNAAILVWVVEHWVEGEL